MAGTGARVSKPGSAFGRDKDSCAELSDLEVFMPCVCVCVCGVIVMKVRGDCNVMKVKAEE